MSKKWAPSVAELSFPMQVEPIESGLSFEVESLDIVDDIEIPYEHHISVQNTETRMNVSNLGRKYDLDRKWKVKVT